MNNRSWMQAAVVAALVSTALVASGLPDPPVELPAQKVVYLEDPYGEETRAMPLEPGPEVAGVTSSRWQDRDRDRIFDELDDLIDIAPDVAIFPVIVVFNERPSESGLDEVRGDIGDFSMKSNKENPLDLEGKMWNVIPAFSADLSKAQILDLAARPDVKHIELDGLVRAFLNTATVETGVDKAVTDFGVNGDRTGAVKTYNKDDIVICVVDTGIYNGHYDLNQGQVIGWKDYVGGSVNPKDDNGHGTHVASIAAGQGDANAIYRGVAYGAALVGVKVLDADGAGFETDIVDGINFCNDNKATHGIEIMTLSLGGGTCTSGDDAMSDAVNSAWNNGLVVTVAAGNDGPAYCTVASPGSAANVITVGAMSDPKNAGCTGYKAGGWYLGDYSSRGKTGDGRMKPDLVAPGTCITAAWRTSATAYATLSGTSMATPFVAGVAALMLDADPDLTPADIKSKLVATTDDYGPNNQVDDPQSYDYGAGNLDAHTAVESACGCGAYARPSLPTHYHRGEDLANNAGAKDKYTLHVTTTNWRIGLTLIIPSAGANKDFDLRLYKPDGTQVATSLGTTRQETISYAPGVTGDFTIQVERYSGSGSYWLDVSAGANSLTLSQDQ